ncbi:hypothetical protein C0995_007306, partial [Termitomyces sp. Mi166
LNNFKATTTAGMESMNMFVPEEFKKQLKQHAELTNMPCIGTYIAPAVTEDECKEKSLKCMAFFGDDHADFDDDGGGLTTMIANSDVPEGYEVGRFHLLSFGFWIQLTWLKLAVFSGLFKHGETPPLSPSGISPESWAYRFMTVYPPTGNKLLDWLHFQRDNFFLLHWK